MDGEAFGVAAELSQINQLGFGRPPKQIQKLSVVNKCSDEVISFVARDAREEVPNIRTEKERGSRLDRLIGRIEGFSTPTASCAAEACWRRKYRANLVGGLENVEDRTLNYPILNRG